MNRVQVVGANGGGVAYSKASVIPWKKRIDEGFYKQKGGGFDMSPGGWFGTMGRQKGGFARLERGRRKKQKGGSWFDGLSQGMFGIKQTRRKKLTEKQRQKKLQEYRDYQKIFCTLPESKKGVVGLVTKSFFGKSKKGAVGSTVYPRVCLV
jgi:hypothetical protein